MGDERQDSSFMFPKPITVWVFKVLQHRMDELVMNRADAFAWVFKNETTLNEDTMNAVTFTVFHSIPALWI
ncbi:MAG: hypothetical protein HN541_05870 [Euryarchaeota archaeon]|nr:hypothetical protein [Euryarchaeota archaeon]